MLDSHLTSCLSEGFWHWRTVADDARYREDRERREQERREQERLDRESDSDSGNSKCKRDISGTSSDSDSDSGDNLPCGRDDKKDTTRRRDDSGQLSLSLSLVSFRVCNCVHARSNPSLHTHTPKQDLDTVLLVAFWLLVCGSRAVARREK